MTRHIGAMKAHVSAHGCAVHFHVGLCLTARTSIAGCVSFSSGVLCAYTVKINGIRLRFR